MNAHAPCEVIISAPDADLLKDLCHQLVDARLASSAHVLFPVTSIYRWDGTVHEATEGRAFLRTQRGHIDEIVTFVKERHPYEVPNVTALPIIDGNPDYLDWIRQESTDHGASSP